METLLCLCAGRTNSLWTCPWKLSRHRKILFHTILWVICMTLHQTHKRQNKWRCDRNRQDDFKFSFGKHFQTQSSRLLIFLNLVSGLPSTSVICLQSCNYHHQSVSSFTTTLQSLNSMAFLSPALPSLWKRTWYGHQTSFIDLITHKALRIQEVHSGTH